jgi:pimeloyl-ACP methyl ester carboxylesterase
LTFVLIHGAGDSGWYWHLVEAELRGRGYDVVAPDLPETAAGLTEYADAVIDAVGGRQHLVVVGQSFGAFTAPLVAARVSTDVLVLVAGMVPAPGEAPDDWWEHTGYSSAVQEQAARDGGMTGNDDPFVTFYHDVPRALAEEAMRRERHGSLGGMSSPWPLEAWPDGPRGSCCAPRTASSRRPSWVEWWRTDSASSSTRSTVAIAPHWPSPRSWLSSSPATWPDIADDVSRRVRAS